MIKQGRLDKPYTGVIDCTTRVLKTEGVYPFLASEEDPRPSRPPSLLGPQGQRSTHQDHRTQGKNCRSVQEEINCLLSKSLINCSVESLCFTENLFHFQKK